MVEMMADIQEEVQIDASLISDSDLNAEFESSFSRSSGTDSYKKLKDLPTLNGRKIIDNIDEEDPTVPKWAKEKTKPTYTAEELNAVNEDNAIPLADIISWFE